MRKAIVFTVLVVALGMVFSLGLSASAQKESAGASKSPVTLAISIRTLSSPYQVMYKTGAEAYAKIVGLPLDVLTTEANSQKGLTDIKAEIARTGGNVVFFVDPNDATDAVSIAKTMEDAGVYWVSW
jgi:ribose transport system substrate-binding protein